MTKKPALLGETIFLPQETYPSDRIKTEYDKNRRISTLVYSGYKETKTETTGAEKAKLFPTDIGAVVNDFLVSHFKGIVDYHFTAKVEKEFDEIAQGMKEWTKMLQTFYHPFHNDVENTLQTAEKARGERELGIDPASGKKVSVRIGRFGPFVQIGDTEGEEKPQYASLRSGQMNDALAAEPLR